jgi:hypothetical protein
LWRSVVLTGLARSEDHGQRPGPTPKIASQPTANPKDVLLRVGAMFERHHATTLTTDASGSDA